MTTYQAFELLPTFNNNNNHILLRSLSLVQGGRLWCSVAVCAVLFFVARLRSFSTKHARGTTKSDEVNGAKQIQNVVSKNQAADERGESDRREAATKDHSAADIDLVNYLEQTGSIIKLSELLDELDELT